MKLRNKKTGEIIDLNKGSITDVGFGSKIQLQVTDRYNKPIWVYNSLAELNEDWEDYEDPKGSALDLMILTLINLIENEPDEDKVDLEDCKQMLEKLKAWKRLKNKGFKFVNWNYSYEQPKVKNHSYYNLIAICKDDEVYENLDLLFGGEE